MLEIGSLVDGKYRILQEIGHGGMSVVYLARNERANKQWAIKEVRKNGTQEFEVVKQNLVAETDMLKKLNNPHLPSIVDVIDGDGYFLIVMDYIEGNPLDKAIMATGAQNQENVISWAKQLCNVLDYLHTRNPPIIYRDMKPSNIMLKPDGNIALIDFGTAREYKSQSIADTTCLGTKGYAAPEQYGGRGQTDARTDIFCLGATLYHLVTGHHPTEAPLYRMIPIRQWNPALSGGLEYIIMKCTQENPEDRYQDCTELFYDLQHYEDLDPVNQHSTKVKWRVFIASCICSVVMAFASVGLYFLKDNASGNFYDNLIKNAASENNRMNSWQQCTDEYKKAINSNPGRFDAYIGKLSGDASDRTSRDGSGILDAVMSNGSDEGATFSKSEQQLITNILEYDNPSYGGKNEDVFKKTDPTNYAEFCYRLGLMYYFNSADDENIDEASTNKNNKSVNYSNAKDYLQKAVDTGKLESVSTSMNIRANSFLKFINSEDSRDTDGNSKVDRNYFKQLTSMLSDIEKNGTTQDKLQLYWVALKKIVSYRSNFLDHGVTTGEMHQVIESAKGLEDENFDHSNKITSKYWNELYSDYKNNGKSLISLAEEKVDDAGKNKAFKDNSINNQTDNSDESGTDNTKTITQKSESQVSENNG